MTFRPDRVFDARRANVSIALLIQLLEKQNANILKGYDIYKELPGKAEKELLEKENQNFLMGYDGLGTCWK